MPPDMAPKYDTQLDAAVHKVVGKLNADGPQQAITPEQWFTIAASLLEIVKNCQEKRSAKQFKQAAQRPSLLQRLAVRRSIKQEVDPRLFRARGAQLVDAAFAAAADANEGEIQALFHEVDED